MHMTSPVGSGSSIGGKRNKNERGLARLQDKKSNIKKTNIKSQMQKVK